MSESSLPLSVTVIMFVGPQALSRCLEALHAQEQAPEFEILVPCDDALKERSALAHRFPRATFLPLSGNRTPAELRAHAVRHSRGHIIGLLEDHCAPDPDWCARVVAAHQSPHAAVGGAVDKGFPAGAASDSALNWAVYLADYSRYMNPMPEGHAASLTDCNVTYKRAALEPIADLWSSEFHENLVNDRLRAHGQTLWFDPRIVVREHRPMTLASAARDRYAFGRLFASTRVEGTPLLKRLIWAGASVVMPPVLTARAARNLIRRGRYREQIARCAPALLFVTSVWMLGEMIGYLTASPGALRARNEPAAPAARATGAPGR
jgi:hypothetical protein